MAWAGAGVSLAINYFCSCCSKNRRDRNCTVCSTESAERPSKKKSIGLVSELSFSFNVFLLILKSLIKEK
jgi:hypothetical protein